MLVNETLEIVNLESIQKMCDKLVPKLSAKIEQSLAESHLREATQDSSSPINMSGVGIA